MTKAAAKAPTDPVAACMAEIVGQPQRIEPLAPEEIDEESLDLIIRIRESLGITDHSHIPEYFRTTVRHPQLFRCHLESGTALFQGTIPPRERALAVLRVVCAW